MRILKSSNFTGLSSDEAKNKLKEYGYNEIKEINHISPLEILLRQVKKNFIIYLLLAAFLISFFVGKSITAYTILGVIALVIATGFIQEYKAEKAVASLKKMIMPFSIVLRDGKEKDIDSREIVPDDIVILGSGEKIPADCVVAEENELRVNESALTGESKEIKKEAIDGNENYTDENLIFMGTFVVNGRCKAKVLHTGMNTRFGKIAGMISTVEKDLPLQHKVNSITKYMAIVAIVAAILTGSLMLLRADALTAEIITGVLILMIALSVSAFPEGFPVVLITTLAVGANRMAKQNAIVNRMSIIETLGETTVICTDKTGTITKGEMTVRKIFLDNKVVHVTGSGYDGHGEIFYDGVKTGLKLPVALSLLFKAGVLCNNARAERTGEDNRYRLIGAPTEGSLLILAAKAEMFPENFKFEKLEEIPFNSERKMMSVLGREDSSYYVYAKGAPEILIQRCKYIHRDGKEVAVSDRDKDEVLEMNKFFTSDSLRALAIAYRKVEDGIIKNSDSFENDEIEKDLVFLGIVAMEDPPREEAVESVKLAREAGIKVKMITGDNADTASAIGRQIGLYGDILTGPELDKLTDDELSKIVNNIIIFARVKPEHKLKIVKALKQNGEIVTMTGDGVNDAPALKEAHIGVAMGKNGTDVSRSVADLTLKDDNFATIITAIKEGRTVFNNLRKFVSYQLSCNLAEILILFLGVLLAPVFGWQTPLLLALHILFMNLVTDNLPAITLGLNPTSKDILKEKPRRGAELLDKNLFMLLIFNGVLMAFLTLGVYYISFNILSQTAEIARTTALVCLILLEIASAFNFRSFRHKTLNMRLLSNKYLFFASVISIFATLIILYTKANIVFETIPVGIFNWLFAVYAAVFVAVLYDLLKGYSEKNGRLLAHIT